MSDNRKDEQQKLLIKFGKRVRTLRKEAGLTQNELATQVDLKRSFSDTEAGKRNPALLNIHKIAISLGVSLAHLLDIDEDEEETNSDS